MTEKQVLRADTFTLNEIVDAAGSLIESAEIGDNREYERALVDLVLVLTGTSTDERYTVESAIHRASVRQAATGEVFIARRP